MIGVNEGKISVKANFKCINKQRRVLGRSGSIFNKKFLREKVMETNEIFKHFTISKV
jgi:hypothetical protein